MKKSIVKVKEKKPKKEKTPVCLKQWSVVGARKGVFDMPEVAVLILATCGKTARDVFLEKYPDCEVWQVSHVADSKRTKDWLEGPDGDPWITDPGQNVINFDSGRLSRPILGNDKP